MSFTIAGPDHFLISGHPEPGTGAPAQTTLAGSGLRIGELLGLSVSDVDFLRRTIRVDKQRMQSGELAPVKSRCSRRTVPVGQVVIDELAAHLAAYPSAESLFSNELG